MFLSGQRVYIEKPLLGPSLVKDAYRIATMAYNSLMSKTIAHFQIIKENDHMLITNHNGINEAVSQPASKLQ